ncbi:unnamed protein product [Clonostachys rhizophaga]|uniref:Aquaporin-1 n=1 Tax=Clonostachys rhizophaga TaxID=160324 RepID=A0A9N9W3S2_9HYPO|nr:unnamed protein product [Clonostachys rhizophaga]
MAFQSPSAHRSARSTPAANISPFSVPEDNAAIDSPAGLSHHDVQEAKVRESDSDTAVPARNDSHDGLRARPPSRLGSASGSKARRYSFDDGAGHPMRSQRPRYRDDWEYEYDLRDYPTMRDYERNWRGDYRTGLDRYTSRRSARPPPAIFNNRRNMMMSGHDSDDDMYHEEMRFSKDPFYESPRTRRMADEEMGYHYPTPIRRETSSQQNSFGAGLARLDWNNLSPREKREVMRLPLTEWMNSDVKNHFVASLGEFVGTLMFLFFAFAGTEVANIGSQSNSDNTTTGEATGFSVATLLYISLSFGFSLMVNVWIFFRISGGLFNPAVTLGMVLTRAISIVRAICLLIAQMAGAIAASAIVRYLFPESFNVRTTLGGGASTVQGVFIEAILTSELVFTIFMLAKEKHRATFIAPVGIGLALFISELVGVQFTGGSLNPARSFGPCVITGTFDAEHWIYWVGPFVGSLIAMANPGADGEDVPRSSEKRPEVLVAKEQVTKEPSLRE